MTILNKLDPDLDREEFEDPDQLARRRHRYHVLTVRLLVTVVVLGSWQLLGPIMGASVSSTPSQITSTLVKWALNGYLWKNVEATLTEVVIGYIVGSLAGIIFGVLFASYTVIGDALDPFLLGLYGVPKIAIGPLLVVWLGIGLAPKVALSGLMVFFLVLFSTYQGIRGVDPKKIDAVRLMGASSLQLKRYVILPGARSSMLLGLKLGVPEALVGAIVGEFVSSSKGIGYVILFTTSQLDTPGVFAGIVVLAVMAMLLNYVVRKISGNKEDGRVSVL